VAAAFVAGAAALVRDYRPKLTATQVRQRLENTADHPTGRLPDPSLGYGIVDPGAAVATAAAAGIRARWMTRNRRSPRSERRLTGALQPIALDEGAELLQLPQHRGDRSQDTIATGQGA
jgi:hypothetical protein